MSKKIIEFSEFTDHPLEKFFDIEPNTTEVVRIEQKSELVEHEDYDEKDKEIEKDLQDIHDQAMSGFRNLQETAEDIDPKYAARSHEVANQLLNTALNALKEKAELKKSKDKSKLENKKIDNAVKDSNKGLGGEIKMDTNSLIKLLRSQKEEKQAEKETSVILDIKREENE